MGNRIKNAIECKLKGYRAEMPAGMSLSVSEEFKMGAEFPKAKVYLATLKYCSEQIVPAGVNGGIDKEVERLVRDRAGANLMRFLYRDLLTDMMIIKESLTRAYPPNKDALQAINRLIADATL